MSKIDYGKASAALENMESRNPEEVYEYKTKEGFDKYMKSHGLKPDDFYKKDKSSNKTGSGSSKSIYNSDSCYLTSACVESRGLPDDCEELTVLRSFRDGYLRNTENGESEINDYYDIAPSVVRAINLLPEAPEIWDNIYKELVSECVGLIKDGHNEKAHRIYREYSLTLKEKYL